MSTAIVIFGASGDLTARKLLPALFANFRKGRLPECAAIHGFSSSPLSDDEFRERMRAALQAHAAAEFEAGDWERFAPMLHYTSGKIENPDDYAVLDARIDAGDAPPGDRLYYLAIAPGLVPAVLEGLTRNGMATEGGTAGFRRIIVEKPFGEDAASAAELNRLLHECVDETQIYRIDHYLGKETVQNVLVLRFANAIFEPLWNRNYVDHVQITVAETVGVGHRARYFEKAGVLRDMFQNHLMQLLTLVAMEPPAVYNAETLRNEKVKVLSALRSIPEELSATHSARGQYAGYRDEQAVDPASQTETYAALKLHIDNWRWQGVPFYLRSGKALREKSSEIVVQFRRPPTQILDQLAGVTELFTNRLSIRIQPDEGLHLRFITKSPDAGGATRAAKLAFDYEDVLAGHAIPDSYQRLLLDALHGDASLFTRADEIALAWELIDGIRAGWAGEHAPPLEMYAPGTWGPKSAERLPGHDGRWWIHDSADRRHGDEAVEERL